MYCSYFEGIVRIMSKTTGTVENNSYNEDLGKTKDMETTARFFAITLEDLVTSKTIFIFNKSVYVSWR